MISNSKSYIFLLISIFKLVFGYVFFSNICKSAWVSELILKDGIDEFWATLLPHSLSMYTNLSDSWLENNFNFELK